MATIGIYNRKGGIGKTSSIINLGAELANQGKRVLLVDGDSQRNMTQFFFEQDKELFDPTKGALKEKAAETMYTVLNEDLNIYNAIKTKSYSAKRKFKNKFRKISITLDVIPGDGELDYLGITDDRMLMLKRKLELMENEYDYIMIDFPPANTRLTMSYLIACDYVMVPVHLAKKSSMYAYYDIMRECVECRENYSNTNLNVLGLYCVNTQFYKSDQAALYEAWTEENTAKALKLFNSTIRHDYGSMQAFEGQNQPLCVLCGNTDIANDYKLLAKEVEKRIKNGGMM